MGQYLTRIGYSVFEFEYLPFKAENTISYCKYIFIWFQISQKSKIYILGYLLFISNP